MSPPTERGALASMPESCHGAFAARLNASPGEGRAVTAAAPLPSVCGKAPDTLPPLGCGARGSYARVLPCVGCSPTSGQLRGGGGSGVPETASPASESEDRRHAIMGRMSRTMASAPGSEQAQPSQPFRIRELAGQTAGAPGAACGFCDPSALRKDKRPRVHTRELAKIQGHFASRGAIKHKCESRLGAEGMASVHRVRRCEKCAALRFVKPGVACTSKQCTQLAVASARWGTRGAVRAETGGGDRSGAGPSGSAAVGQTGLQVGVGEASRLSLLRPTRHRPEAPQCAYCESLDTHDSRAGDIVRHLNSAGNEGQCVKLRLAAQWRAKGVYVCGCGLAFTAETWRRHSGCGFSGIGPSGVSIGEGRPVPPSETGEAWNLHPNPPPPHRPHFPPSATARECPPAALGGCGKPFATFTRLLTHLKATACGGLVQEVALRDIGVRRCGRSDAGGTCRALLETHTGGSEWEHNRICNFRVGGAAERPPPPPPQEEGEEEAQVGVQVPRESWDLLMGLDMLQLSNAPGPTFGYVPDRLKPLVAECWAFASREALRPASAERGFRLLQAFSSMLLLRKRGDNVSAGAVIARRCRLFKCGEWDTLLSYARGDTLRGCPRGVVERPEDQLGRRVKRALEYASKGELSKAAATLEAAPMAPPSAEALQQLRALHPAPDPRIPRPERPPRAPALVLDRELFDAYVSELPRSRAPGCTGFRLEHLQAIVSAGGRDTLYALCNHILAGGVPAAARPYFAGARLFALEKPQGGVRPIACGEVLRRVVATLVCRQLRTQCAEFFASGPQCAQQVPAQLGVGVRGGGEVVVHGLQVAMEANPTWALCTVDWKNAFNACSRARMLREVSVHFPALYPFVDACYSVDPVMVYGVQEDRGMELHTILSSDGTQQGDPLGPLLFALLLHPVLRATMDAHPELTMLPSFLDDTGIPGPPALVAEAFKTLVRLGYEMAGMTVNQSKCSVFSPDANADFSGFPEEVRGATGARLPGVTVLSAAIGKDEWVEQQVRATAVEATGILPSLHTLDDPQTAYLLLSACIRPRIVHLLRACRPELCNAAMRVFHETLLTSLAGPEAAVMKGSPLDFVAERFASLPTRVGGLGFVRGERLADAAFLGSFALVWPVVLRLFPLAIPAGALLGAEAGVGTLGALREAHRRVTEEEELVKARLEGLPADTVLAAGVRNRPSIPPLSDWQEEAATGVQKQLSWVAASLDYLDLRDEVVQRGDVRTRAWLSSVTSPDSIGAAFLRCIPAYPALRLDPTLFPVAARAYLIQPQPAVGLVTACSACQGAVDPEGTHFLTCKPPPTWKLGNPSAALHDGVVRTLGEGMGKVFPGPRRVFVESREYNEESRGHRPDIVVAEGNEQGGNLFVEVSVIRPMARNRLQGAALGGALKAHEVFRRTEHYPARVLAQGTTMVPFVADVYGCLGPESSRFFRRMADTQRGWDEPVETRGFTWREKWSQRVAITIARTVARTILERGLREQRRVRPTEEPETYNRRP